jgi:hypothetical protein
MRALSTIPIRSRAAGASGQPGRSRCGAAIGRRRVVIAQQSPIGARQRPGGMRSNSPSAARGIVERSPAQSNPRLEITPSLAQYRQLCRDLKKLRKLGAPSHTQAIVAAVHAAASANLASGEQQGAGRG